MRRKVIVICIILLLAVAFALLATGCAGPSDEAKTDETTGETTQFLPTKGLEFDENGNPTPESAEQIYRDEMEKEYQEYLKKEQEEIMKDYYLSQPDPDPDAPLPGGH